MSLPRPSRKAMMNDTKRRFLFLLVLSIGTFTRPSHFATADTIADTKASIQQTLDYLAQEQLQEDERFLGRRDYAGNWPQFISPRRFTNWPILRRLRWRDVNPFTPSFIHHALTFTVSSNQVVLGLSEENLASARSMRKLAIACMLRFESPEGQLDAGTFGFWPDFDPHPRRPSRLLGALLLRLLGGPQIGGNRLPMNIAVCPDELATPSDADDTATILAALLDDKIHDGGPGRDDADFVKFFEDWRDTGEIPFRIDQSAWKPQASGSFLTWLNYQEPGVVYGNDVDLVTNSNVLYALGRYGRLDTTDGVDDTVALINAVVSQGLHLTEEGIRAIAEYYPNNLIFQALVSRAYYEGGVSGLEPSVNTFVGELLDSVIENDDGTAYWDLGEAHLNTGLAILTLLNGGEDSSGVVERAIRYLIREQNSKGSYDNGTFFVAITDTQITVDFKSPAFVTSIALEAMSRWLLLKADEGSR